MEFSFEDNDLTSLNITNRLISEYLDSPNSIAENHKTSELVNLLKEVKCQNSGILRKLDELKELVLQSKNYAPTPPPTQHTISSTVPQHPRIQSPQPLNNLQPDPPQQQFLLPPITLIECYPSTPPTLFEVNQCQELSWEKLMELKQKSSSLPNFAVNCLRLLFKSEELEGRNIAGRKKKMPVDPVRVEKIRKYVFKTYPTPADEQIMAWRKCKLSMDEFIRRPLKRKH